MWTSLLCWEVSVSAVMGRTSLRKLTVFTAPRTARRGETERFPPPLRDKSLRPRLFTSAERRSPPAFTHQHGVWESIALGGGTRKRIFPRLLRKQCVREGHGV